jgi:hypothetical protein
MCLQAEHDSLKTVLGPMEVAEAGFTFFPALLLLLKLMF